MRRNLGRLALALVLTLLATAPALGSNLGPGGGTRVIVGDQVIGPYRLLITSSPEPAIVGTLTYAVRVTGGESGARVLDADVAVELAHAATGKVVSAIATHESAGNPVDFAAHLELNEPGSWNGKVTIRGDAGIAETTFVQRVSPPRSAMTLVAVGLPFLAIVVILGGIWLARGSRAKRLAPDS